MVHRVSEQRTEDPPHDRGTAAPDPFPGRLAMSAEDIPATEPEVLPKAETVVLDPKCLLHRCAAGDQGAVVELSDRFKGLIASLARRYLDDKSLLDDTINVVLTEVWRAAQRFDPQLGSEVNFVGLIARRKIIDINRRTRNATAHFGHPTQISEALAEAPSSIERLDSETLDNLGKALRALAGLPDDMRRAVQLFCRGLTHNEIAEAMDVPLGTAKTWIRRGVNRLREKLPDLVQEP